MISVLQETAGKDVQNPRLMVQAEAGVVPALPEGHYRIYFVEEGRGQAQLDNWTMPLAAGNVVTASPTEHFETSANVACRSLSFHHDFFCVRVKRSEVYCDGVVFNRVSGEPRVELPISEWPVLRAHFADLQRIVDTAGVFAEDRSVNALRSILLLIAEYKMLQFGESDDGPPISTPLSTLVLDFQDLLEAHYTDKRDVSFYSNVLGVTGTTLSRRLKSELGQTVSQAINERVAIQARMELRTGNKSVKRVALELGFDDPLYFSRFFKKHFGFSPSRYFSQPTPASSD